MKNFNIAAWNSKKNIVYRFHANVERQQDCQVKFRVATLVGKAGKTGKRYFFHFGPRKLKEYLLFLLINILA